MGLFLLLLAWLMATVGNEINVLMAACAWNLRKWLVIATIFLFWQKLGLFFSYTLLLYFSNVLLLHYF
jgi:hypothetical protein